MTDKKISNAPAPITPVRWGGATGLSRKSSHETEVTQVHTSSTPDWSCWLASRSVTLDEAVTLTLNLDPDSLQKTGWFITSQSFADQGTGEQFSKRLGAIQGCFKKSNIKLSVIAEWAVVEAKWNGLPPEFVALAATFVPVVAVVAATLTPIKSGANNDWVLKAQDRAIEIIKRQKLKDFYPSQVNISDEIAKEFRADGIVGSDGKPLSGATIKRHALKGISSAKNKQLSTQTGGGKRGK